MAISTLSLALNGANDERTAGDWRNLVHRAFEEGVNAFEIVHPSESLLLGFGEGVASVRRSLLFLSLRIEPETVERGPERWVEDVIAATGIGDFNLVTIAASAVAPAWEAMLRLREQRRVHHLGVAGSGDELGPHVLKKRFDALVTPFNLLSSWRDRQVTRNALERQMGVIACNPCPVELAPMIEQARASAKGGVFKRSNPLAGAGSYRFLAETRGWSAEQICLAYALTEPAVATVQVDLQSHEHLEHLAEATARDLPSAVSAQIEMARFSPELKAAEAAPARRSA